MIYKTSALRKHLNHNKPNRIALKICSDICPYKSSFPRSSQSPERIASADKYLKVYVWTVRRAKKSGHCKEVAVSGDSTVCDRIPQARNKDRKARQRMDFDLYI